MEKQDPIDLLKEKMIKQKLVSEQEVEKLVEKERQLVEKAVDFARNSPLPDASQLFEDLWSDPVDIP